MWFDALDSCDTHTGAQSRISTRQHTRRPCVAVAVNRWAKRGQQERATRPLLLTVRTSGAGERARPETRRARCGVVVAASPGTSFFAFTGIKGSTDLTFSPVSSPSAGGGMNMVRLQVVLDPANWGKGHRRKEVQELLRGYIFTVQFYCTNLLIKEISWYFFKNDILVYLVFRKLTSSGGIFFPHEICKLTTVYSRGKKCTQT